MHMLHYQPRRTYPKHACYRFRGAFFQQLILITAFLLAGCQSLPKSEALQIAHAAGLKNLKDVPREKLEEALKENPDMTTENMLNAVGVGTKIFSQSTSWSLGAETGALILLAILEPVSQKEKRTRFLVWMPRKMASSPEVAAAQFKQVVVDAFARALPNYNVFLATKNFGESIDRGYLAVEGIRCEDCGVYSHQLFDSNAKPIKRKAPEILGSNSKYKR